MSRTSTAAALAAGLIAVAPIVALAVPAFADTSGDGAVGGGNQVDGDANAPVDACGNAVAVLGLAGALCDDSGAVSVDGERPAGACEENAARSETGGPCEKTSDTPARSGAPAAPRVSASPRPADHAVSAASLQQGAEREEPDDEPDPAQSEAPRADALADTSGSPAPVITAGAPGLPLTGSNLMALVAVALTAVVSGAGVFLLSRRRGSTAK